MNNPNAENSNKIFVGGLSPSTTQQKFHAYFEQFGEVREWMLMIEKETGRSRGFGFIVMKNIYDTYKIFTIPVHVLDNKQIDCKKAVPKDKVSVQSKGASAIKKINETKENNHLINSSNNTDINISETMIPSHVSFASPQVAHAQSGLKMQGSYEVETKLHANSNSYIPESLNISTLQAIKLGECSQTLSNVMEADVMIDPKLMATPSFPLRYSTGSKVVSNKSINLSEDGEERHFAHNSKKIFVGGLPHGLTEEEFKFYFNQFGEIEDCVVMHDKNTGKPRGFGFITYENEESVDIVMRHKLQHKINGKWIEWKRATPKAGWISNNNEGNYVYEEQKSTSFYTHTPDKQTINQFSDIGPLTSKLSNNNLESNLIPDNSFVDSQTTSDNTFTNFSHNHIEMKASKNLLSSTMIADNHIKLDNMGVNERLKMDSLSEHTNLRQGSYFTKLLAEEDTKPILDKVEKLNFDEDKIPTYDEMLL